MLSITEIKRREKISKAMVGKRVKDKNPNSKPMEHYEVSSSTRTNFKKICKVQGWNFEDFQEVFAEWYYKTPKIRERKYNYFYKLKQN